MCVSTVYVRCLPYSLPCPLKWWFPILVSDNHAELDASLRACAHHDSLESPTFKAAFRGWEMAAFGSWAVKTLMRLQNLTHCLAS